MNPIFFGHNVVVVIVGGGVNTRNKRAAVLGLDGSYRAVLPAPDGTINAFDRCQLVGKYPL